MGAARRGGSGEEGEDERAYFGPGLEGLDAEWAPGEFGGECRREGIEGGVEHGTGGGGGGGMVGEEDGPAAAAFDEGCCGSEDYEGGGESLTEGGQPLVGREFVEGDFGAGAWVDEAGNEGAVAVFEFGEVGAGGGRVGGVEDAVEMGCAEGPEFVGDAGGGEFLGRLGCERGEADGAALFGEGEGGCAEGFAAGTEEGDGAGAHRAITRSMGRSRAMTMRRAPARRMVFQSRVGRRPL